jgi:hypothetical protein
MTEEQFYKLVKELREHQVKYFKTRDRRVLSACKDIEKDVDKAVRDYFGSDLFAAKAG